MPRWPFIAVLLVVLAGCGSTTTAHRRALSESAAQTLRTCVDRWNAGHMRDWGPALASVGLRGLGRTERAAIGLRPATRRCVVTVAFQYPLGAGEKCSPPARSQHGACIDVSGTWSCAVNRFGAYACPLRHEPFRVQLTGENARVDAHGVMILDVRLEGTHAPPRLAWQRYPRTDGWIEPWTLVGTLRRGLRFDSTYAVGGTCDATFRSELTPARSAIRCLWHGLYQVDPCFAPPGRWNHRGGVVACGEAPGSTTFGRFVIGPPSYKVVDFPDLQPWTTIGSMFLGESRSEVVREYGAIGHPFHLQQGYFSLHDSQVFVAFRDGMLNELDFTTRYYRTWDDFGVGSRIPFGPCHRTATSACEHRWHGFVWNAWNRDQPCSCWVKVGDGSRSLPATAANFLKPWVILYVRHGRVSRIFMAQKFVD